MTQSTLPPTAAAFDAEFGFAGWLGVQYAPHQSLFRLWAPTAQRVSLCVYASAAPAAGLVQTWPMTPGAHGVWCVTLMGDQRDLVYTYQLQFETTQTETIDPYATAATRNGARGVVLAPEDQVPKRWGARLPAFGSATDAVIVEVNIRDLSSQPSSGIAHAGQYLGLTEVGTHTLAGTPTGLDYLARSGATHVQLMPFFDFGSVDEAAPRATYNWGYDPVNWNVPEGSYATDPATPKARVQEAKAMIQALHDRGLRVIMDVVYNHVFDPATSPLARCVPGYFFRQWPDGQLADGTGVGNDFASERVMARKYIVDSITYWAQTYQLDGFRFDLMGILDVATMQAVRQALDEVAPGALVLGEGWDMNTPLAPAQKATQGNAAQLPSVAFFNDQLRDAIKGNNFDAAAPGFVAGNQAAAAAVAFGLLGGGPPYVAPTQVVQYAEAHDNLTLVDKLAASSPTDTPAMRVRRVKLANSLVALSQGVPFFQLGQAFLRSKGGNANSYNAPDAVNGVDWPLAATNADAVAYLRGLLALRRKEPALRQTSYAAIAAASQVLHAADGVVVVAVGPLILAFNAQATAVEQSIPAGDYRVLVEDGAIVVGRDRHSAGTVTLAPVAALVLKRLA
ncbi:type I pullulanase [Lacticaseibacillus daqingensis]|uniref:type I pullulanase n=1 Tax=Lacticaseibacillus daqingensis TaxID=2486014 RepID=UPI000F798793|nr:type I pullulanase [Lacticaseibacillus daqingensis]